jgi:hypothetical protein
LCFYSKNDLGQEWSVFENGKLVFLLQFFHDRKMIIIYCFFLLFAMAKVVFYFDHHLNFFVVWMLLVYYDRKLRFWNFDVLSPLWFGQVFWQKSVPSKIRAWLEKEWRWLWYAATVLCWQKIHHKFAVWYKALLEVWSGSVLSKI